MAKTKTKTKTAKKRVVKCGKCKVVGHNARTCKVSVEPAVEPAVEETKKASDDIPPPPLKKGSKTKIDMRVFNEEARKNRIPKRDAPTKGTSVANNVSPYRCEKCNSVAPLVVVKIKDYDQSFMQKREVFKGDVRCESCFNKPTPGDLILKWGATPGEVVPIPGQDDDA